MASNKVRFLRNLYWAPKIDLETQCISATHHSPPHPPKILEGCSGGGAGSEAAESTQPRSGLGIRVTVIKFLLIKTRKGGDPSIPPRASWGSGDMAADPQWGALGIRNHGCSLALKAVGERQGAARIKAILACYLHHCGLAAVPYDNHFHCYLQHLVRTSRAYDDHFDCYLQHLVRTSRAYDDHVACYLQHFMRTSRAYDDHADCYLQHFMHTSRAYNDHFHCCLQHFMRTSRAYDDHVHCYLQNKQ